MSEVGRWPIEFIKQWILPISYVVGLTYDGYVITPSSQHFNHNFLSGEIRFSAVFEYPVVAVYAYSYFRGYYTDPITVVLDYPTHGIFFSLKIEPWR